MFICDCGHSCDLNQNKVTLFLVSLLIFCLSQFQNSITVLIIVNLASILSYPLIDKPIDTDENKWISNKNHNQDLNNRDIWGSAHSMFYLNHQAKVQQLIQRQQQLRQEKASTKTTKPNYRKTTTRRIYAVPQLFVSYGWGPMG